MSLKETYEQALAEKEQDSELVWSILPSYDMHTRALNRSVVVTPDPLPSYNKDDTSSLGSLHGSSTTCLVHATESNSANSTSSGTNTFASNDNYIITDEDTNTWTDTVLNNIHNLRNLTYSKNRLAQSLDIKVYFTKEVGEYEKTGTIIDPQLFEYKKGDYINGYILVDNKSTQPITFEMFYVLFEGTFMVTSDNSKKPVKIRKFLEMFDFSASYNETYVQRLFGEDENAGSFCPNIVDPVDGTRLGMLNRTMQPGWTYKRFFTFKIPEHLLDNECDEHQLLRHTQLPPTLGISRMETVAESNADSKNKVKDFAQPGNSISYGMIARFIGRASQYNAVLHPSEQTLDKTLINSRGDEFVILKESYTPIRVIQQAKPLTNFGRNMKTQEVKVMYNNLVSRIEEKLKLGNSIIESINQGQMADVIELSKQLETLNKTDQTKDRQLYRRDLSADLRDVKMSPTATKKDDTYDMFIPFRKKKALFAGTPLGTLQVSFPKLYKKFFYVPPPKFRTRTDIATKEWKVSLPIDLLFKPATSGACKLPEIKQIDVDLTVFSLSSPKYAYPVELDSQILFSNEFKGFSDSIYDDEDNYTERVKRPFRKYATQLYDIFKTLGSDNFKVEKNLVDDLKAVCEAEERYLNLAVPDVKVENVGEVKKLASVDWKYNESQQSYHKNFNLLINMESCTQKGPSKPNAGYKSYDNFCLVPSFQTCNLTRQYYLRVYVTLSNNDIFSFKVPVTIKKF